ncbi:hypothetical protein [Bordetella sp. N]|uniref:hypothetical protein n=1 Tax=Bordetella sp. N TaxID=1746199 RepID=UPI00070FAFF8|nr:hypothetical protein [Bordetella sp. N]ALM84733.1 hypothetical protein ASB57_18685 [Bordetella sp. N]
MEPAGGAGDAASGAAPGSAAWWRPASAVDVRVARELCAEYGVVMALAETRGEAPGRLCLWVDPRSLNSLRRLDDGLPSTAAPAAGPVAPAATSVAPEPPAAAAAMAMGSRWRAGPGVTMATLAQAGLEQFAGLPGEMTVAAWLASRAYAATGPGLACPPGLISADVMLADGALETLGPFGASGGVPLRSGTGQALIPALYTLSTRANAERCRAQAAWLARYRLDALTPPPPAEANLAGLLAGHEGALAWLESAVLQATPPATGGAAGIGAPDPSATPLPASAGGGGDASQDSAETSPYTADARALDAYIKDAFDPAGMYPDAPVP